MEQVSEVNTVYIRAPRQKDLAAICEMLNACDVADCGMPDSPLDQLRGDWQDRRFHLQTDAWLAVAPDGRIAGYAAVNQRLYAYMRADVRIHPAFRGQGIGSHLLSLAEQRAHQFVPLAPAGARVTVQTWHHTGNQQARQLLEAAGFAGIRLTRVMHIELQEEPSQPVWPEGLILRPFVAERDAHAVFEAVEEAFGDHWGHLPQTFEDWSEDQIANRDSYDPSLWFLAWAGEHLAGVSLCGFYKESGIVNTLGVRRPWRKCGLGMALLRHSFAEFYRRGTSQVGLGVDAQNLTGATRLYERAGMSVLMGYDLYEKELRPGVELRVQTSA
jgi:mycothiol synthase